jgi:hypothetical protein
VLGVGDRLVDRLGPHHRNHADLSASDATIVPFGPRRVIL